MLRNDMDDEKSDKSITHPKHFVGLFKLFDIPITYFREKIVLPYQLKNHTKYYHRILPRVKTIDQCEIDDFVCIYEADTQYMRDKHVDDRILMILRKRFLECRHYEGPDGKYKCKPLKDTYDNAAIDWFIKYGDIGARANVIDCYMKQKHRLVWNRQHPDDPLC